MRQRSGWCLATILFAVLGGGCAYPAHVKDDPVASKPPQERCPYAGTPLEATKTTCAPEVISPFLESVSAFGHERWNPQRTVARPNAYVDKYGGQALMTVVDVGVDASGMIADVTLQRSSGVAGIDAEAMKVFPAGRSVLYPPACALTDGRFRFRIGLCVEVLRPKRWQPPAIQQEPPREHLDVVSDGSGFGR